VLDSLDHEHDEQRRKGLKDELIEVNLGVAQSIASRYRHRGIADEDLEQVAYLALVRVVQSYDHGSGHDFLSYAVPSIRGEVRRHFRDQGWVVRPPRRVQEIQAQIAAAESELGTELGHPPTADELAERLGQSPPDVHEALAARGCFAPASLDKVTGWVEGTPVGERLGREEEGFGAAEARVVLAPVLRTLNRRERRMLEMRFITGCTQQEIADEIGVTQMQVSRLLGALMRRLRADLETGSHGRVGAST
jgi:RNA polymerase sigma-B factor